MSLKKLTEAYVRAVGDGDTLLPGLAEVSHRIFKSRSTGTIFLFFCLKKETTAGNLMRIFGIPEPSTYRGLKTLRDMGVIEVKRLLPPKRKFGPREKMWGLVGGR